MIAIRKQGQQEQRQETKELKNVRLANIVRWPSSWCEIHIILQPPLQKLLLSPNPPAPFPYRNINPLISHHDLYLNLLPILIQQPQPHRFKYHLNTPDSYNLEDFEFECESRRGREKSGIFRNLSGRSFQNDVNVEASSTNTSLSRAEERSIEARSGCDNALSLRMIRKVAE